MVLGSYFGKPRRVLMLHILDFIYRVSSNFDHIVLRKNFTLFFFLEKKKTWWKASPFFPPLFYTQSWRWTVESSYFLCAFFRTLVRMCRQRPEVDLKGLPSLFISVESRACSYGPLGMARLLQGSALSFVPPDYMWPATPTQHVQGFWRSKLRKCWLGMMVYT